MRSDKDRLDLISRRLRSKHAWISRLDNNGTTVKVRLRNARGFVVEGEEGCVPAAEIVKRVAERLVPHFPIREPSHNKLSSTTAARINSKVCLLSLG